MPRKSDPFPPYPAWTTSRFFSFIRSALRKAFQKYPPKWNKLEKAKAKSSNKRYKWRYRCESCGKWWPKKDVHVDHIIPAGQLKSFEDLPGFVERLFCSEDGLAVLCRSCHQEKTNRERKDESR